MEKETWKNLKMVSWTDLWLLMKSHGIHTKNDNYFKMSNNGEKLQISKNNCVLRGNIIPSSGLSKLFK